MAITYGASPGTVINSFAMTETLGSQTQQTGNNTVVVSNSLAVLGGTYIGTKYPTYVGRMVIINLSGAQQRRMCISQVNGTGTTRILTVHEDWAVNPISGYSIHVPYDIDDMETGPGSGGGGITLNAKTGLYELTNVLTLDPGAGLQNMFKAALEFDDRGTNPAVIFSTGSYYFCGYSKGGVSLNGSIHTMYNNAAGEPTLSSGPTGNQYLYDTIFWSQLVALNMLVGGRYTGLPASHSEARNCAWILLTQELLFDTIDLYDCAVTGRSGTSEVVRFSPGVVTTIKGIVLSNINTVDSLANTNPVTITIEGMVQSGVTNPLSVRQNKTWNLIDPIWTVTTYTQLTWVGTATGNEVNDRRSVKVTVQKADGTKLQDTLVNIYENTALADLVLKLVTAATTGYAEGSFIYKKHATNSVTTTYGGHALQCGKWLYEPYVATQASTDKFNGVIVLNPDNSIVQTTQATAISDGSGITWNKDTNPSTLLDFTGGSGTVAVGMILTFSPSGAVGTVTELKEGDSTAGTVHLKSRNATAIANGDTFSRTGGTAGTFSGTYTNDSKQSFTIWIDAVTKSLQTLHDYLLAIMTQTTLGATGELIWEWCRDQQTKAFYSSGSDFYTERAYSKGIIVVNAGAGSIDHFTDDAGVQWTPFVGAVLTVQAQVSLVGAEIRIYDLDAVSPPGSGAYYGTELAGTESNASSTYAYNGAVGNTVLVQILLTGYVEFTQIVYLGSTAVSLTANLVTETNA